MPSRHHVVRDISYAHSAETRSGRMVIKLMENTTGRLRLIRRADGYEEEVAQGRDFWSVMVDRYGLALDVVGGALTNIPKEGPLILIANHPYGILDGLMLVHTPESPWLARVLSSGFGHVMYVIIFVVSVFFILCTRKQIASG